MSVLTDQELQTMSDEEVAEAVRGELLMWKRRSLRPTPDFSTPGHGFVLALASQRLAYAAPDAHLEAFAQKLRELWGARTSVEPVGEMVWEEVYLQHPTEQRFWKFTFSVDFFGAQGDGRWWHDHRAPGGLLFTANSVGHMRRYRELYEGKAAGQTEWVLQSAMKTIADAAETKWGPATWLKRLGPDGLPVVRGTACPFSQVAGVRGEMSRYDWTRYGGFLHSDHSIRPEFFHEDAAPSDDIKRQEHLQDFTYLYDSRLRDHAKFMGIDVTAEEVAEALGAVDSWTSVPRGRQGAPTRQKATLRAIGAPEAPEVTFEPTISGMPTSPEARARIDGILSRSVEWQLSKSDIERLES